jgi:hypothetical protein
MDSWNQMVQEKPGIEWMLQNSQVDDETLAESIVSTYASALLEFTNIIPGSGEHAEIVIAEATARLVKYRHRYNGQQDVLTWLLREAEKQVSRLLHGMSWNEQHTEPAPRNLSPLASVLPGFESLAYQDQQILLLRFRWGQSSRDIAGIYDLPYQQIQEKLIHLRKILLDQPEQPGWDLAPARSPGSTAERINFEELRRPQTGSHMTTRLTFLEALEGEGDLEKQNDAEVHLHNCESCRQYVDSLCKYERRLNHVFKESIPADISEEEGKWLIEAVRLRTSRKFGVPLRVRELSVGIALLVMSVLLGLSPRVLQIEPQATVIILATQYVTPSPGSSFTDALESLPVPGGSLRGGAPDQEQNHPPVSRSSERDRRSPQRVLLDIDLESLYLLFREDGHTHSAPASLASVLHYWERPLSLNEIKERLQPWKRDQPVAPQDLAGVLDTMRGINALYFSEGRLEQLKRLVSEGFPVIVLLDFDSGAESGSYQRYETLYGYDDRYGVVWLLKSAPAKKEAGFIQYADFLEMWESMGSLFLVVYPEQREKDLFGLLDLLAYELDPLDKHLWERGEAYTAK